MKLSVKVCSGQVSTKEVEIPDSSSYFDLLACLNINPETVVVFKDGVPVAFDDRISDGKIDIMRVVSGG